MIRSEKVWKWYEYVDPDQPANVAMWQRCMKNADESLFSDGRSKQIVYLQPCSPGNNDYRLANYGKPDEADRLLYNLPSLRMAIELDAPAVFWCEGEKDCTAADELLCEAGRGMQLSATMSEGPAVSHHGGASKATPRQAEHFRGYRGLVYVAVDRDDAGAACGVHRFELLRSIGVRARLVGPAPDVIAPKPARRELCGTDVVCYCDTPCPAPTRGGAGSSQDGPGGDGADLTDHLDAGYGLRDLVRLRPRDLRAAADRHRAREVAGWRYGGSERTGWAGSAWARGEGEAIVEGES